MTEEYYYQKIEDLNINSKLRKTIMFKPISPSVTCFIVGVAIMFVNNLIVRLLGAFFILMAVLVYVFVKDKKVADIYDDGCLIYHTDDQNLGYFIKYDDISEWEVSHEYGRDSIIFTLKNGNRAYFDTFQANKAYDVLDEAIHDKEKRVVQAKRNKDIGFKFPNPFKKWSKKKDE